MKEHLNVYNDVLQLVGNTPLVRLNRITQDLPGSYFAKVEAFNPGNSSKDRIALYIIEDAEFLMKGTQLSLVQRIPESRWES